MLALSSAFVVANSVRLGHFGRAAAADRGGAGRQRPGPEAGAPERDVPEAASARS